MTYRLKNSKVEYQNQFFQVVKQNFSSSHFQERTYYTLKAPAFCASLPINPAGWPGLVKVYRFALKRYGWEIPGGGREQGETTLAAAKREMREETGFVAKSWRQLGSSFALANGTMDILCYPYLAQDLKLVGRPDPEEIAEFNFFSPLQIKQMIQSTKIIDAATQLALVRAGVISMVT